MSYIEQLEKRVEEDGVIQISGGIFKDHIRTFGGEEEQVNANTTVREYCEGMGLYYSASGEEYARQILEVMDSPCRLIVSECNVCYALLSEDEIKDHFENCKENQ